MSAENEVKTPIEKAAQEAASELFTPNKFVTEADTAEIITKHLAPVQAELEKLQTLQFELDSKRVDSLRLAEVVVLASGLFVDDDGLPDPCDDANYRIRKAKAELDELATIRAALKDPAAVWVNMLRGTIARPQALDHYEDCKARVETLEAEVETLRQITADSVKALKSGVVAPDASLEFVREVPKEIRLVVDAKDKLLREARGIIDTITLHSGDSTVCDSNCPCCKAQDWLARVKG